MKEYRGHEWWRLMQIASKVQVKFFKIPKNCQMASSVINFFLINNIKLQQITTPD